MVYDHPNWSFFVNEKILMWNKMSYSNPKEVRFHFQSVVPVGVHQQEVFRISKRYPFVIVDIRQRPDEIIIITFSHRS